VSFPVIFKPEASKDVEELEDYLADHFSSDNAQRYILRLVAACTAIGMAPQRGSKRMDVGPSIRSIGFERRVTIIFEVSEDAVYILALLYGGRQSVTHLRST
jgi:toxin ParE1/3/4